VIEKKVGYTTVGIIKGIWKPFSFLNRREDARRHLKIIERMNSKIQKFRIRKYVATDIRG
jgi:hypothetical protein